MILVDIENLKYPIGKFSAPKEFSPALMKQWIHAIEELPSKLRSAVIHLNDQQLDTPYRDGGWTVRQVVHHIPDSHMNAYIRFKLAMTEDIPTIKPYFEDRWAELADYRNTPVEPSLSLLDALHYRWELLLKTMTDDDFKKKYHHPESHKDFELRTVLALYAWHGNHHLAHITSLLIREGWNTGKK